MDVVREKISEHGPIASVKKVSASGFAVEHVDGHMYVVAVPAEFRVSPIKSVVLLDQIDQGISIELENGDRHAQFFPALGGWRDSEGIPPRPSALPAKKDEHA